MDQKTALNKIEGKEIIVLDVRSVGEFEEGHVPGAINIPHNQVEERLAELSQYQDKPVLVYCRSGRRAAMAETILTETGFKQLHHLQGDMIEWSKNNLPIEK